MPGSLRVAFFSPMPPAVSGIADYSEALVEPLGRLCSLEIFPGDRRAFDPTRYDIALYQLGNNPDHAEAYERALEHPGVIVLHEANLHHLVAALTIQRNDWEAYLREVEFDGGPAALEFARRVRALETGPDYEGVPMLRRVLSRSRGLIAHSDYVIARAREAGFSGPAARIPHGAWIPDADRMEYRRRLGLDAGSPLVGVFGHLKPYKRIGESLRAFRRVVEREQRARMILVGEPHPELPLDHLRSALKLNGVVRVIGRAEIADFVGYMAACDVVLNLRHPTVGETSGTLLRALGLGKAVIVSDCGAFAELPDDVCLKAPVGVGEEEILTDYLTLLVQRRDLASALGARARDWVERTCSWDHAARMYADFLEAVAAARSWSPPAEAAAPAAEPARVEPEYLRGWVESPPDRQYLETHLTRLEKTLSMIPPGTEGDRILEMGAYLQITPALRSRLGYGEVRGCYYGRAGQVDRREKTSESGELFCCEIDLFDAEKDVFPYPDGHFAVVLCCELIEHLASDPMFMMAEINRVLRDGGRVLLSTPNICSLRALAAILQGFHPGFFPAYLKPSVEGDARHNREYTPKEIQRLLHDAGFEVEKLDTGPFRDEPRPELIWVEDLLSRYGLPAGLRGDGIYALARKTGPVRDRWPAWLYS